jgi:hypothetical protein
MRSALIVVFAPGFNLAPRVGQVLKPVCIQTLVAKAAVEAFDETVLRRLAGLNVDQPDATLFDPRQKTTAGEFRSVVDANTFRTFPTARSPLPSDAGVITLN